MKMDGWEQSPFLRTIGNNGSFERLRRKQSLWAFTPLHFLFRKYRPRKQTQKPDPIMADWMATGILTLKQVTPLVFSFLRWFDCPFTVNRHIPIIITIGWWFLQPVSSLISSSFHFSHHHKSCLLLLPTTGLTSGMAWKKEDKKMPSRMALPPPPTFPSLN